MDLFGHKEEISRLNDENSRLRDALKDAEQQYESIFYVSNKLLDEFNAARDQLDAALAGIFDLEMQLDDAILDIQSMEILMIYKPYLIVNSKRLEQKVIWIENEIKERGASYNTMLTFVRQREELLNERLRLYNSLKDRAGVLKADVVDGQKKIDKLIAFKSAQTEKISKIRAKMHELLESLKDLEGPKEESDA
nr:hypothetical protein Iba_chr05eCG11070 [Ipomoea batatas]